MPGVAIDPKGEAVWPFIVLRASRSQPLRLACMNSQSGAFDGHVFARGTGTETGEDYCGRIGGAFEAALADNYLNLDGGGKLAIKLSDMGLIQDLNPDDWHYFAQINWTAYVD